MQTTRFVILAQPRTGSTMLCDALSRHPDVLMRQEILNHWQMPRHRDLPMNGAGRLRAALEDPNEQAQAVGCKLLAFQPDRGGPHWSAWEPAWEALAEDKQIKVILLKRQNLLAQYASWKIAERLGKWGRQPRENRPTIHVDPFELRWFREWNRSVYEWRLSQLRRHQILDLTYESLDQIWYWAIHEVQEFLGINPRPLNPSTAKNETRPLSEVIENYDELRPEPCESVTPE